MARKLKAAEREYVRDAAFGYLNGFNDIGEAEYPKLTVAELVRYAYETIEFDREYGTLERDVAGIYFAGRKEIEAEAERIIRSDSEFSEVCIDWN